MVDQVIKDGAPDDKVRAEQDFRAAADSRSGITRRMRLKFLMQQYSGKVSDSDLKVVEESGELLLAIDEKLKAQAHGRAAPTQSDVRESLSIAEAMLWRVLIPVAKR